MPVTAAPTQTPTRSQTPDVAAPAGGGPGHGGGRGGRGGAMTVDPRDRARLEEAPVRLSRVLALFGPHRRRISVVVALIVVSSRIVGWPSRS